MPNTRVMRGGLIGCGYFGQIQLESWRRMSDAQIVATCDANPTAHAASYTDAATMLDRENLDFVDIATRPASHLPLLRLCLERKLPVILQKPLAPAMPEALEMLRLTEESGGRVMVHENWRWQPWHREMRRRVQAGDIGQPFGYHFTMMNNDGLGGSPYPNQPYFKDMPKLLMFESLIHPLDTARFHFGEITGIYAVTRRRNPLIAGEDRAILVLQHAHLDGIVEGNRYLAPEPPGPAMGHSLIEGETGRLQALATGDLLHNGKLVWQNTTFTGYKGDSVKATQQHFIDCLISGQPFETGIADYLNSFAAIEAAYLSAREGRTITLA